MAVLPRPSGPRAVWRDFRAFLRGENRHKLLFAVLAIALPAVIFIGFARGSVVDKPPPQMWFVQSWPADRPDAVIVAQNKADQIERDKLIAAKRASFKRLADRLGIE